MTLLLASVRPADLLLTADGRVLHRNGAGAVVGIDDAARKLFPVPDHPVVVAHHGLHPVQGRPMDRFLDPFLRGLNAGNLGIVGIADELRQFAHAAVRTRLAALPPGATWGCGFWVAGFGGNEANGGRDGPSMVELFWSNREQALATEERRFTPTAVVAGGDGEKTLPARDWRRVADKPLDAVRDYHLDLQTEAARAPGEPSTVGGQVHELVITREGWRWTLPPPRAGATRPVTRAAAATAPARSAR